MPFSQVSDRIKEVPGQVLRAVFGGIGKILLGADKIRSEVADQLSGGGQPGGAEQPGPTPPPRPAAGTPAGAPTGTVISDTTARPAAGKAKPDGARWRSLDETGNVRLLGEADETEQAEAVPVAEAGAPGISQAAGEAEPGTTVAEPEPADLVARPPAELAEPEPAELATPEPAVAEPAVAEPAVAEPAGAEPAVAEPAVAEPAVAEPAGAEPAGAEPAGAAPAAAVLPVPGYDELSVASLRARLRFLDPAGVRTLLEYEKAHQGRAAVITMFERRLSKLDEGS